MAADVLMPLEGVREARVFGTPVPDEIQRPARIFKVSTRVALRRLRDAGLIDQAALRETYRQELARIRAPDQGGSGGGHFYRTLIARTGKRFGPGRDGDAKTSTFYEVARNAAR